MNLRFRLIKRFGILAAFLVCLGCVLFSSNARQTSAARCCQECEAIDEYCSTTSDFEECMDENRGWNCYATCIECGGSGGECSGGCSPGWICWNGYCVRTIP